MRPGGQPLNFSSSDPYAVLKEAELQGHTDRIWTLQASQGRVVTGLSSLRDMSREAQRYVNGTTLRGRFKGWQLESMELRQQQSAIRGSCWNEGDIKLYSRQAAPKVNPNKNIPVFHSLIH